MMFNRDRAPFELSGGHKKRAATASVPSLEPDVLLDEPTASLDPRTNGPDSISRHRRAAQPSLTPRIPGTTLSP